MTHCRKRLLLVAPNLHGGGAERTLARLANHWVGQGRFVTVLTISNLHPEDFPLAAGVERIGLGLTSQGGLAEALRGNYERMRGVRWGIQEMRPDVVVSFIDQTNVLALLAARSQNVPVVISERVDPTRHPLGAPWRWLRRRTYPWASNLVVLTDDMAQAMSTTIFHERIVVIPNSVEMQALSVEEPAGESVPGAPAPGENVHGDNGVAREPILLAMGRLAPQKGLDRLIAAVSILVERGEFTGWKLVLAGNGPTREELEEQAAQLPAGTIEFAGRVANPTEWYRRASLFALPSRYEGFPNALLEAMACGLPAVAFENSATRQIIRHDWDGLLVPEGDTDGLANAISRLLADTVHRQSLGHSATEVVNRFPLDEFWSRWDAVVDQAQLVLPANYQRAESLAW